MLIFILYVTKKSLILHHTVDSTLYYPNGTSRCFENSFDKIASFICIAISKYKQMAMVLDASDSNKKKHKIPGINDA